jgi:uncharacterized coiled-coil protein SlyX
MSARIVYLLRKFFSRFSREKFVAIGIAAVPGSATLSHAMRKKLMSEGAKLGAGQKPPTDSTALTDVEESLVTQFEQQIGELRAASMQRIQQLIDEIEALPKVPTQIALSVVLADLRAEFARLTSEAFPEIERLRKLEQKASSQLEFFKAQNGLLRDASYPKSLVEHFAIVLAVVLAECAANSAFFAEVSEWGLVGGTLKMLPIALANVGLAVMTGAFVLRLLNHRSLFRRAIGALGGFSYAAIAVALNLAVASFRDALAVAPDLATSVNIASLLNNAWSLTFDSAMLFCLGIAASLLSLYKGYRADDAYPGYGALTRKCREHFDNHEAAVRALRNSVSAAVESCKQRVDQIVTNAEAQGAQRAEAMGGIRAATAGYRISAETLEKICHTGLKMFREANLATRKSPPPGYFATYPTIARPLDAVPIDDLEKAAAEQSTLLEELRAHVIETRKELASTVEEQAAAVAKALEAIERSVAVELGGGRGSNAEVD